MNIKPRLKNKLQPAYRKTLSGFKKAMPSIAGVLLLIGLIQQVDLAKIQVIFTGNFFFDAFFGALVGSVAAGNPITSYIIGGELLSKGVSMFAVTAFILAWVTVGIVQLPAESIILGRRFALTRNITSFLLAIFTSIITVATLGIFL